MDAPWTRVKRTPPSRLVRSIQEGGCRRYAGRKIMLYRTQTSNFTFKMCNFHQELQET